MTDRLSEKQVDALITAYLDGSLSDADRATFEAWLRASPDHPRRVARLSATDFALHEVCHDTKAGYLLDILNQIDDASGPAQLVTLHHLKATRHPYRLYAISGAVAAVLLLAVTLLLVFSGTGTTPEIANETSEPNEPGSNGPVSPITPPTVATLTAQRDAVWAPQPGGDVRPGALAQGTQLSAGQRLVLTQGLAEITTTSGAIAILEAPATIQLINNNALHLHVGKLVGICETESSKGFLVRTPHIDVTDLGTRFGVDLTVQGQTHVEVFDGQVVASLVSDEADQVLHQRLVAGQAAIATPTTLTDTEPRTAEYAAALNVSTGMAGLYPRAEGDPVLWLGEERHDLSLHAKESDLLQVFLERRGLVLGQAATIDLLPGETWPAERGFGKATVSAGTVVDVYLLHLDPVGNGDKRSITRRTVLHFDRPIVGLIGAHSTLQDTDQRLGLPGVTQPSTRNASLPTGGHRGIDVGISLDAASISEDGKTLTLVLEASEMIDQIRILVQSQP
jgi:ferric-dicitrate binding protein FerR (iron transport regulator)